MSSRQAGNRKATAPTAQNREDRAIEAVSREEVPRGTETRSLGLADAITIALDRNADLAVARATEPVAHAAYHVAQTYPWNPQFQTQVLPYSRDRGGNDGAVSQQYVIVQTFELGGQQRFRQGAAAANWEHVEGTVRQAELLNVAQTTRLYFAALYQKELRDISASLAALNEQLVGVIERRQNAGQSTVADVELARLNLRSALRQQRLAEANYQTAISSLRNQLNLDADEAVDLPGRFSDWQWHPIEDVLSVTSSREDGSDDPTPEDRLLRLVARRPDVVAARAAVAMAAENLRLVDAMRRPNLQLGPMWQRDDASTEFLGIQGQIDIPVVNTGKPLVAQRAAELRLQEITATQLENKAVLQARAAIERYERARKLVEESQSLLAGDITKALNRFDDQFKAGQITLLQVYAARTSLVQSRQSYLDLLNELAQATADVVQATELPPGQLATETSPVEALPQP